MYIIFGYSQIASVTFGSPRIWMFSKVRFFYRWGLTGSSKREEGGGGGGSSSNSSPPLKLTFPTFPSFKVAIEKISMGLHTGYSHSFAHITSFFFPRNPLLKWKPLPPPPLLLLQSCGGVSGDTFDSWSFSSPPPLFLFCPFGSLDGMRVVELGWWQMAWEKVSQMRVFGTGENGQNCAFD